MSAEKDLIRDLKKLDKIFVQNMKRIVPVRKGRLKDSIEAIDKPHPGVDMLYYGQYVNDGTYKMAAQPFINDAWDMTVKQQDEQVFEILNETLNVMFNKTFE